MPVFQTQKGCLTREKKGPTIPWAPRPTPLNLPIKNNPSPVFSSIGQLLHNETFLSQHFHSNDSHFGNDLKKCNLRIYTDTSKRRKPFLFKALLDELSQFEGNARALRARKCNCSPRQKMMYLPALLQSFPRYTYFMIAPVIQRDRDMKKKQCDPRSFHV